MRAVVLAWQGQTTVTRVNSSLNQGNPFQCTLTNALRREELIAAGNYRLERKFAKVFLRWKNEWILNSLMREGLILGHASIEVQVPMSMSTHDDTNHVVAETPEPPMKRRCISDQAPETAGCPVPAASSSESQTPS